MNMNECSYLEEFLLIVKRSLVNPLLIAVNFSVHSLMSVWFVTR